MTRTVAEIADALGIEEKAARGLVAFMLSCSPPLARFRGERASSGVGRGPSVYQVEQGAGNLARRLIERLE